jgi:hypothetical protein
MCTLCRKSFEGKLGGYWTHWIFEPSDLSDLPNVFSKHCMQEGEERLGIRSSGLNAYRREAQSPGFEGPLEKSHTILQQI